MLQSGEGSRVFKAAELLKFLTLMDAEDNRRTAKKAHILLWLWLVFITGMKGSQDTTFRAMVPESNKNTACFVKDQSPECIRCRVCHATMPNTQQLV